VRRYHRRTVWKGKQGMRSIYRAALGAAVAVSVIAVAAGQQIYRWVDKDGRVHFTTQPPPRDAKKVERVRTPADAADPSSVAEMAAAARKNPVVLYRAPPCEKPCDDARAFLTKRGVPHRVVDLKDLAAFERFQKETGAEEVPVLVIGRTIVKGFEVQGWTEALDAAGFPKSAPPPLASGLPVKPKPEPEKRGRYESALPAPPTQVRLFVSTECGAPCEAARKHLAGRGVSASETSVDDPIGYSELETLSGDTTVPVLVVGPRIIKGFEAGQYNTALDAIKR
jgi:glutaredoxin